MNTISMKREEVLGLLQGDENTEIELILHKFPKRNYEKIRVKRAKYDSPSIPAHFVINGQRAAYIQMNRISEKTPKEFTHAVESIDRGEYDYFILDLRNNPGGYLGQASEVADHFLKENVLICKTQSKTPEFDTAFVASARGLLHDLPVAVLIDSNSASGAEIIAGAIQDNDRGILIGMASYGKATAQKFFNMTDSSAFRLTVAHYVTPLGREIQRIKQAKDEAELDPAARLQLDEQQFAQINEMLKMHGGLRNLPIYTTPKGRKVFGGGGILPDYFVQYDTTTVLTRLLRARAVMLTWAMNFIEINYDLFEKEYKSFDIFDKKFNFTNDNIVNFANFCAANNIWNADMFKIDRAYILYHLKALIAYVRWGTNEYNMVMVRTDPFVRRALELRQEAVSLIKN
jgi:carboxyl-terminal processing protease